MPPPKKTVNFTWLKGKNKQNLKISKFQNLGQLGPYNRSFFLFATAYSGDFFF